MKNRLWRQRSGERGGASSGGCRQDSQESTISTSSSIREFELFQQFCSNTSPDWVGCITRQCLATIYATHSDATR